MLHFSKKKNENLDISNVLGRGVRKRHHQIGHGSYTASVSEMMAFFFFFQWYRINGCISIEHAARIRTQLRGHRGQCFPDL